MASDFFWRDCPTHLWLKWFQKILRGYFVSNFLCQDRIRAKKIYVSVNLATIVFFLAVMMAMGSVCSLMKTNWLSNGRETR